LNKCYKELFLPNSSEEDQAKRIAEVEASIKSSNKYDMTADELEFGSRTAWRNAPRCIGRIQWSKLKVKIFIFVLTKFY